MKTIVVLSDSYRADHIGAAGKMSIHTPNLDRLASMSGFFTRFYAGSFPTGANRRDLHLGRGPEPGRAINPWKNVELASTAAPAGGPR